MDPTDVIRLDIGVPVLVSVTRQISLVPDLISPNELYTLYKSI